MHLKTDADDRAEREYADFTYTGHFCSDCRHHLGGGQCRLNAESECAEGGGFELWEKKNA